jgi:hypothetical protein
MLYYLVDALPALLGSIATLWAVCSPRHWFVRSSFLAALLLLFLLIPAYELLVAGCMQIAIIMGGINVWRKRRDPVSTATSTEQHWRISLRNLLLFTVLAAVAMAVLASFPKFTWSHWLHWVGPGFGAGCVTLFAVWLACSKKRLLVRWFAAIGFVFLAAATETFVQVLSWATGYWTNFSAEVIPALYAPDTLKWAGQVILYYAPVNAIGLGLMWLWIHLFARAGWFDPFGEGKPDDERPTTTSRSLHRVAWIALTMAIAVLPVTLLVKLAMPKPQLARSEIEPQYYEDLEAAAALVSDTDLRSLELSLKVKDESLGTEISKHANAMERMRVGFHKGKGPYPQTDKAFRTYYVLYYLCRANSEIADRLKDPARIVDSRLDMASLGHVHLWGTGAREAGGLAGVDLWAAEDIWRIRSDLTPALRETTLATLGAYETDRPSWDALLSIQRIEDINAGWLSHLHVILDDWLGNERYAQQRVEYHTNRTKIRLILLDLALLSYQETNGRLPDSLEELVPGVLKELPADPYADGPLKFRRTGDGYALYSVGPNKIDEHGQGDDETLEALMRPAGP